MVYAVIYGGEIDDYPVRVFSDKALAEEYAAELYEFYESDDAIDELVHHPDVENANELANRDCSTYSAIAIATYDADGKLTDWEVVGVDDDATELALV
jgi:hypothetical protein